MENSWSRWRDSKSTLQSIKKNKLNKYTMYITHAGSIAKSTHNFEGGCHILFCLGDDKMGTRETPGCSCSCSSSNYASKGPTKVWHVTIAVWRQTNCHYVCSMGHVCAHGGGSTIAEAHMLYPHVPFLGN